MHLYWLFFFNRRYAVDSGRQSFGTVGSRGICIRGSHSVRRCGSHIHLHPSNFGKILLVELILVTALENNVCCSSSQAFADITTISFTKKCQKVPLTNQRFPWYLELAKPEKECYLVFVIQNFINLLFGSSCSRIVKLHLYLYLYTVYVCLRVSNYKIQSQNVCHLMFLCIYIWDS